MKVISNIKEKIQSAKDSILSTKEKFVEGLNQVIWGDIDKIHTNELSEALGLNGEDDNSPPIMPTYNLDDF